MNIGAAAKASGVPAKTIRYYESIGLIEPASRSDNGYRRYTEREVELLRFVQRARSLGFTIADVSKLLTLWMDRDRASADVRDLALEHIADVERRIAELESIRATLTDLVNKCHGDHRPDCPIIDGLAGHDCPHGDDHE